MECKSEIAMMGMAVVSQKLFFVVVTLILAVSSKGFTHPAIPSIRLVDRISRGAAPCDVPSDATLSYNDDDDFVPKLRSSMLTTADGQRIRLGDYMNTNNDDDTTSSTIIIFLRHLG